MKKADERTASFWLIRPIGTGPKHASWFWETRNASGALTARSAGFANHGACLDDAIAHGYLAAALSVTP
jgi:hypothetical protein